TPSPMFETTHWLIKLETKDGKLTGSLVASNQAVGATTLEGVSLDGNQLRVAVKGISGEQSFEGRLPAGNGETILGSFGNDRRVSRTRRAPPKKTPLKKPDMAPPRNLPEPMQKATALSAKANSLRPKAAQTEDPNEKSSFLDQAAEAETQAFKLYQEVLAKH